MFEHLKNKRVLVTGPQRSGTTICAHMIAHDAGLDYVDECDIGVNHAHRARSMFASRKNFVLQAPGIAHVCHTINADCVVFMIRPVADIIKSQERIGWGYEKMELGKYGEEKGPIAKVKYDYWIRYQKNLIDNACEVGFDELLSHHMYIHDRANFTPRQWRREKPV